MFTPDIREPNNEDFQKVSAAYAKFMGEPCPEFAVGGGTDAKGYTFLLAAGPLFSDRVGPPINYHGIGEGSPLDDMQKSTLILYNAIANEIEGNYSQPAKHNRLKARTEGRPEAFKGHRFNF